MKLQNALFTLGFLVSGTLPWFTLGPASTLGIMGWAAGLFSVLAVAAGAAAGGLSLLADKGMPTKTGNTGPRLAAAGSALASLSFSVVWLSSSSNTQASVGNDTMLLHYGPGAVATIILAVAAVVSTGYQLVSSKEPIPPALAKAASALTTKFTSTPPQGAPDLKPASRTNGGPSRQRPGTPGSMAPRPRPEDRPVGADRQRPKTDLHVPETSHVPAPDQSAPGTQSGGGPRVPAEQFSKPSSPPGESAGQNAAGGVPGAGRRGHPESGAPDDPLPDEREPSTEGRG